MTDGPNDLGLMTLREACEEIFRGRLTPSSLCTEAAKGNLEIIQIARKDFVTVEGIREMMDKCRVRHVSPIVTHQTADVALAAARRTAAQLMKKPRQ